MCDREHVMDNEHFCLPHRLRLKKQYIARLPSYRAVLQALRETIEQTLADKDLQCNVQARLKSFESYFEKMLRLQRAASGNPATAEVNDLLGLRIVCPFLEDVKKVEQVLDQRYEIVEIENKARNYSFREFGYDAVHLMIRVPRALCLNYGFPEGLVCEIQLRTILQQAWAEVEHELVYKGGLQPFEEHIKRKLAALNANLNLADTLFQEIRESQRVMQQQTQLRRERLLKTAKRRVAGSDNRKVPHRKGRTIPGGTGETAPPTMMSAGNVQRVDALLLKALHAHNSNNYQQAIDIYGLVLKQKLPLHVRSLLYNHRGMAYFADRQYQKSLRDFSTALSLYPENDRALYYRGIIHQLLGRYAKSIKDFSSCLAVNPYHLDALYSRARAYDVLGEREKAIADCRAVLKIKPDSTEAQHLLASLTTA